MAKRNKRRRGHPDFRHRVPGPVPSVAEVEAELYALLTPALLAARQLERRDPRNPARLIRLPSATPPDRVQALSRAPATRAAAKTLPECGRYRTPRGRGRPPDAP